MTYRESWSQSQVAMALDRLRTLDERTRIWCSRNREGRTFTLDFASQRVLREPGDDSGRPALPVLKFPKQLELVEVWTSGSKASSGKITIPYFEDGTSVSWYVSFEEANSEHNVLFCGRTGQAIHDLEEKKIAELFDAIR